MSSSYEGGRAESEFPSKEEMARRLYAKATGIPIKEQDIEVENILGAIKRDVIVTDPDGTDVSVAYDTDPSDVEGTPLEF